MKGVSKLFRTSGKRAKPSLDLPEGLCGQYSLAEMKIATNNFNDKLLVGEGDFGRVYKGSIDDCTRIVAIKWLKFKLGQGLVFEDLRIQIRIGVALALHYLHIAVKQTIIHGDVKPADVLLDENWEFKLSDFKSSKMVILGKAIGIRSLKHQWPLASWDKKCKREETMNKIIDLYLMGKIASECFNIYMDIATSCVQNKRKDCRDE
ncbi:receptor-like protein kinase FERONIA [Castanea sativa]|uniref:receptor-like protein kinase FERONIA n=1 Tax=Castanea sativa TaxID=21020 RepID=UPI003F64BEF9